MKSSKATFTLLSLVAALSFVACKSDSDREQELAGNLLGSSTMITDFSIKANGKVMENLNKVFFTIDQTRAEIFNADSLPWGTDVRKLVPNITTQGEATVQILMPSLSDGRQVTVEASDSVNFTGANGVMIRVTSADGNREQVYRAKVNVHQSNPDSLQWVLKRGALPAADLVEQQTVALNGGFFCLGRTAAGELNIYSADDPNIEDWPFAPTGLPANTDVNSLVTSATALYVLTAEGQLLESHFGTAWQVVANGWDYIYGGCGADVVGIKDGKWVAYPSGKSGELAEGMPRSGASRMWSFTNDWALAPMGMFVGDGDAWGFDGTRWMRLSGYFGTRQLPQAQNMILVPYFTFRINSENFLATKQSMWLAFGGKLPDGSLNKKVYISLDNGVNWLEGSESIQLPTQIALRPGASVFLEERTFNASRAIKPITEWDAPYIHLLGGYDEQGRLVNEAWTGVINRLTYKPLQ